MKKVLLASLALLLLAFFALPAMATFSEVDTLASADGATGAFINTRAGNIAPLYYSDGVTRVNLFRPFVVPWNPPADPTSVPVSPPIWWDNNRSRIFDPASSGYPDGVPSPAHQASGEMFDIEGVFWQQNASGNLNVWVVTSVGPDGRVYGGNTYHLGDVFINTDFSNDGSLPTYEYALLSFDANPGRTHSYAPWSDGVDAWDGANRDAGELVALGTTPDLYGINGPNSYRNYPGVVADANPWAAENGASGSSSTLYWDYVNTNDGLVVDVDTLDGSHAVNDGTFDGRGTYIYFWDVAVPWTWDATILNALSVSGSFHVTVQCGNDLAGNPRGSGGGGQIPAPGALILGIIGAGLVGLRRRMKA